jgi:hypothetical protein
VLHTDCVGHIKRTRARISSGHFDSAGNFFEPE